MNIYKPVGWRYESYRHSLARKGIKTKPYLYNFSIKEDWAQMGTVERALTMADSRSDFVDMLKEANKQGYLDDTELKRIMSQTKGKNHDEIVKWFYSSNKSSMAGKLINFLNDSEYRKFKKAYLEAKEKGDEQFDWNGQIILVIYAKYLLQHVEDERERRGLSIYKKSMAWKETEDLKKLAKNAKEDFKKEYAEAKEEAKYEILTKEIMRMKKDLAKRENDIKELEEGQRIPRRLRPDVIKELEDDIKGIEEEISVKGEEKKFAENAEKEVFQKTVSKIPEVEKFKKSEKPFPTAKVEYFYNKR